MRPKKVVVIGGGTGTFTVLTGLKKYPLSLTAIVSMADDGGSTGVLRDELGVLPPGDVRQCLIALSESDFLMRSLMNYRFENGGLKGHNFGNILLSALEKITGSFDAAVEKTSEILRLEGSVIPVTLDRTRLVAHLKSGKKLHGQNKLPAASLKGLKKLTLAPAAKANQKAVDAIKKAHVVIIGPGDFYSSLAPNLLVKGIPEAIRSSKAKKVYICNLMTKKGHTDGWTVNDYVQHMEESLGKPFDYVVYNNKRPVSTLLQRYSHKGEELVEWSDELSPKNKFMGTDLVSKNIPNVSKSEIINRSLIRHNPNKLARLLLHIIKD